MLHTTLLKSETVTPAVAVLQVTVEPLQKLLVGPVMSAVAECRGIRLGHRTGIEWRGSDGALGKGGAASGKREDVCSTSGILRITETTGRIYRSLVLREVSEEGRRGRGRSV